MQRRPVFALALLLILLLIGLTVWGWVPPGIPTAGCALQKNAAWISSDWTAEPASEVAVQRLAEDASRRQLRYLFPFATYVQPDGSFSPSYSHAAEFVSQFRRFNRDTRLFAWIGVPLKKHGVLGVDGWVDLADRQARQEIATFVAHLVEEAGFDGVHLDVETVRDGDQNYLRLLDEVRVTLAPDRQLSVASGYWVPATVNALPIVGGCKWSASYYRQVGARVDQVVAMTYDSLMPNPALYRTWMRGQVRGITESLEETDVELLIGLSVSQEKTATHHPSAENLSNGLAAMCAYLARGEHQIDGVALYAAWEATAADWTLWDQWLTQPEQSE
jgi:hypothetical protein